MCRSGPPSGGTSATYGTTCGNGCSNAASRRPRANSDGRCRPIGRSSACSAGARRCRWSQPRDPGFRPVDGTTMTSSLRNPWEEVANLTEVRELIEPVVVVGVLVADLRSRCQHGTFVERQDAGAPDPGRCPPQRRARQPTERCSPPAPWRSPLRTASRARWSPQVPTAPAADDAAASDFGAPRPARTHPRPTVRVTKACPVTRNSQSSGGTTMPDSGFHEPPRLS